MEKISSREEAAARLKEKEEEINRHFEALQDEVKKTRHDAMAYVKENPWISLAGITFAGILVGLILGKRSQREVHEELVETYIDRLAEMVRRTGVTEDEAARMLRDALRETLPSVVYKVPKKQSRGLGGSLFSFMRDVGYRYLVNKILDFVENAIRATETETSVQTYSEKGS